MAFLSPSREKLLRTLIVASIVPVALVLLQIQVTWDVLDLRLLGRSILALLLAVPIRLLDWATDSAFAPRSEAFLVFPSLVQVVFALVCDVLLFYLLACTWVAWRRRPRGDDPGARSR